MSNDIKHLPITPQAILWGLFAVLVMLPMSTSAATFVADNGLIVNIHAGDDLAPYLVDSDDALILRHPAVGDVELFRGPDDPRFPRADVTEFRPLSSEAVTTALREVHSLRIGIEVDVFILPSPPVLTSSSFARRNAILLAPSFGAVDESAIGSVTVHELGHVLTWGYFDQRALQWEAYMRLRGLDEIHNGPLAPHAHRAREILAEDIRFLFGGPSANVYRSIENRDLILPDQVDGLSEFLANALSGAPVLDNRVTSTAFPNPCNPRTTIELALGGEESTRDASTARLELFDVRGHRVQVVEGGDLDNGRLLMSWDGCDDAGMSLPSGLYLYVAGWTDLRGRGTVTLVK